jgi:uroporphyrinogen III methyltransferase / synthase
MKESEKIPDKSVSSRSKDQPLAGKTILITRPLAQSKEMTLLVEQLGARAVHCPTIEVVEPSNWDAVDAAINQLAAYNWIIFTSANGAVFFFHRLAEKSGDVVSSMSNPVVCAIGPATAKAIENAGVHVDVIAADSKAEGALRAIIEHAGGESKIRGLRFLIPRARIAREVLPVELGRLGARVDAVETYQTVKPDTDIENIIRLLNEAAVDAITFTSSSTVANFAALVGAENLSSLLQNTLVACIGPVTAATALEHGLSKIVQPEVYNTRALVEAIVKEIGSD